MMQVKQQIHMHSIGFRKMRNLVEHILNKDYDTANQIFESEIETVTKKKLNEAKKMTAAKMCEQIPAFMGAAGGNAVKLRRGVLEEDDLDEMDLSSFPPDYKNIEDKRGERGVNSSIKTDLGGEQKIVRSGKGDAQTTMKEESEELDEARIKILKARVRGGKIQRRKKVSGVEGYKLADGKLKRMSPAERRRRKLGQKRGKLKRRSKMRQALMKRKRSLRKRAAIGL